MCSKPFEIVFQRCIKLFKASWLDIEKWEVYLWWWLKAQSQSTCFWINGAGLTTFNTPDFKDRHPWRHREDLADSNSPDIVECATPNFLVSFKQEVQGQAQVNSEGENQARCWAPDIIAVTSPIYLSVQVKFLIKFCLCPISHILFLIHTPPYSFRVKYPESEITSLSYLITMRFSAHWPF